MTREEVRVKQLKMNANGAKLTVDGRWGPKTEVEYQRQLKLGLMKDDDAPATMPAPVGHVENPAYKEAKKFEGKKETDASWRAYLVPYWRKVGLPGYTTLVGTAFAWCGLFLFAMNTNVGYKAITGAAGARNWARYGVEVEWQKNGIPRGAVMHINGKGNCSSSKNNHVTFADGDCTAADLRTLKRVPGFGGNQSNAVRRSFYSTNEVCEVRWPAELPKPGPVAKSVNCSGSGSTGGSTR